MTDCIHPSQPNANEAQFPATFTMHTPNGETHCCVPHARQVQNLFRFMGCHVNATAAPENSECANCVNEAKVKEKTL